MITGVVHISYFFKENQEIIKFNLITIKGQSKINTNLSRAHTKSYCHTKLFAKKVIFEFQETLFLVLDFCSVF